MTLTSGLAIILKRDRKAVSRDVKLLESLGLLRTRDESNPGHGVKTVVEPLAEKISSDSDSLRQNAKRATRERIPSGPFD